MDAEFACQQDPENTQMTVEKMRLCADSSAPMAASGCFDCNICLDFAVEPVVTLCGHLYCWPCIYKWLQLESTSPPQCPVCKAALSQTTLVPLYGRGSTGSKASEQNDAADIPSRPSVQHRGHTMAASLVEPGFPRRSHRQRHQQQHNRPLLEDYLVPTVSTRMFHPILGGTAVAVLPWVFGDHMTGQGMYYSSPFYVVGGGSESPRAQRHEMEVRRSLHRISIFLFFCMIICLLLF